MTKCAPKVGEPRETSPKPFLTSELFWRHETVSLAEVQNVAGYWTAYDRRPPIEDGPIVGTALTLATAGTS